MFFKGCNLKYDWCHNPECQSFKAQIMFYRDRCSGCGKCTLYCPVDARKVCNGRYTADEVLAEVIKDKSFYESSGGVCMLQVDFLLELLKNAKKMVYILQDIFPSTVLNNLKRLFDAGANVWICILIISNVNDNIEEMKQIKSFIDI